MWHCSRMQPYLVPRWVVLLPGTELGVRLPAISRISPREILKQCRYVVESKQCPGSRTYTDCSLDSGDCRSRFRNEYYHKTTMDMVHGAPPTPLSPTSIINTDS